MRNIRRFCALCLLIPALALAQSENKSVVFKPGKTFDKPTGFLNSLLDPSRFSMSQSYTMSFMRVGNQTLNQGLYLNTMNYRISNPLLAQVRVGFLHQPFGAYGNTGDQNGKLFLQRAMLQYRPSDKMSIVFDYQAYPTSFGVNPYYTSW
jgi:hypothetical protein